MDVLTSLFENFGISWPKFGAQLVLFIVVYILLSKFAFGPVIKMLEDRRKKIEEGQLNADKIKRQLAEAEAKYKEIMEQANSEAGKLLEDARLASEAQGQKLQQQAIRDAEGVIAKARETIEQERGKMVAEVRSAMVSLVVETTGKVTGKVLTDDDQKRLADETAKQVAA